MMPAASASARSRMRGSGPVSRARPVATSWDRRRSLQLPGVEDLQRPGPALGLNPEHGASAVVPSTSAVSNAAAAASCPLFPALPPARSIACCMVSTVSTPKPTGSRVMHCHRIEAPGCFTGHVLEVRSLPPYHCPEGYQAGIAPGLGRGRRCGRKLECSRDPDDIDVCHGQSGFLATGQRTLEQLGRDQLVVSAYQDRHPPGGAKAAGEVGHGVSG